MLNEIYHLHKSLEKCGLAVARSHTWIQPLTTSKGSPFFIVGIDGNGDVGSLEYRSADKMQDLWQVKESNNSRFPAMKIDCPLWAIDSRKYWEEILPIADVPTRWNRIAEVCEHGGLAYAPRQLQALEKQICRLPPTILAALEGCASTDSAFMVMHRRLCKREGLQDNESEFIRSVTRILLRNVQSGAFDTDARQLAEQLLLGKWNKKKEQLEPSKVVIILDFDDYATVGGRITSDSSRKAIVDCLQKTVNDSLPEIHPHERDADCALSGRRTPIEDDKAPQLTLPIIGQTYLMSMNEDAPCHYRYGAISSDIFPVGRKTYQDLGNALVSITEAEREGRTWRAVPSPQPKKSDLLIVYLVDKPTSAIQLASIFSTAPEDEQIENAFESTTKTVCNALKGEPALKGSSLLRLFVLSSVDPGRKQLVANCVFTVSSVLRGSEEWKAGACNIPSFSLPLRENGETVFHSPSMPSPAGVMDLFKSQWNRQGHGRSDVHGVGLSEVYDVFVHGSPRQRSMAEKLLGLFLGRTTPLLLGLGGAARNTMQKGKQWKPFTDDARRQGLRAVALMGILLFKLNIRKENYMNDVHFNIGRMLALADTLHFQYCNCVRDGSAPPQLIGNSLMATALTNPERALSMLAERLRIYLAWAETAKRTGNETKDKAIALAGWCLSQYGRTASLLKDQEIPRNTTDAVRAQILLGYLARGEKRDEE